METNLFEKGPPLGTAYLKTIRKGGPRALSEGRGKEIPSAPERRPGERKHNNGLRY